MTSIDNDDTDTRQSTPNQGALHSVNKMYNPP
jgi:hypothetical protein